MWQTVTFCCNTFTPSDWHQRNGRECSPSLHLCPRLKKEIKVQWIGVDKTISHKFSNDFLRQYVYIYYRYRCARAYTNGIRMVQWLAGSKCTRKTILYHDIHTLVPSVVSRDINICVLRTELLCLVIVSMKAGITNYQRVGRRRTVGVKDVTFARKIILQHGVAVDKCAGAALPNQTSYYLLSY